MIQIGDEFSFSRRGVKRGAKRLILRFLKTWRKKTLLPRSGLISRDSIERNGFNFTPEKRLCLNAHKNKHLISTFRNA